MVRGGVSRPGFALLAFGGVLSAQTCTFTLNATPQSFPIAGETGTVSIIASSGTCVRTWGA